MRAAAIVASTFVLIAAAVPAQAMTARELLNSCDAALRTVRGSGASLSIAPAGQRCWNYMEAMQDMAALGDEGGHRLLGVCLPEAGRTDALVRTFATYARAHPDELDSRASAVLLYALRHKFSCK